MPNRVIREGLVDSKKVASLSDFAYRVYTSLFVCVDDAGRLSAAPEMVKAKALPRTERSLDDVAKAIAEIEGVGLIYVYEFDGEQYLQILKWQCLGRTKNARYPFDDGSFGISLSPQNTRDGEKLYVTTSLTRKRSHILQRPHSDPIGTPSCREVVDADKGKWEEGSEKGKREEVCAASAARAGVGPVPRNYTPEFEVAFTAYRGAFRGGKSKHGAFTSWWRSLARIRARSPDVDPVEWLHGRIVAYAKSPEAMSQYGPLLASWLNAGGYDDDDAKWSNRDGRFNTTQRNPSFRHPDDAESDWLVADDTGAEGEG